MSVKILEITPYEPPASGWVARVKLLRNVIESDGGKCAILDIGPNRTLDRPGCVSVKGLGDYVRKVFRFVRSQYTVHCHVNGEYFRGLLLAIAALLIAAAAGRRRVTTFHAGTDQLFLTGWRKAATWPFYFIIFSISEAVICNSDEVKSILSKYANPKKINPVQAFSRQYLEFEECSLGADLERFIKRRRPVLSTYLCFREGFFIDVLLDAISLVVEREPNLGLVIVGTGDDPGEYCNADTMDSVRENLFLAGDLDHNQFMTLLQKSVVHVRTPVTDGVSATVLEALALNTPVVASENGNRPDGVTSYAVDDPQDLARKLLWVIENHAEAQSIIPGVSVADTARVEVDLLCGNHCRI